MGPADFITSYSKCIPLLIRRLVFTIKINRKEHVVLTRCRIGLGIISHSYLLNNEERPECNSNYSLSHVLIDCVDVADDRKIFCNVNNLYNLFTNITGDSILNFL